MHNLRFDESLIGFTWPPSNLPLGGISGHVTTQTSCDKECTLPKSVLGNSDILKIVEFFAVNLDRSMSLLYFPDAFFWYAKIVENAAYETTRREADLHNSSQDWNERKERFLIVLKEVRNNSSVEQHCPFGSAREQIKLFNNDIQSIERDPIIHAGLQNILLSGLLNAWTSFESSAVDLWLKAVDLRPKTLAYHVVMLQSTGRKRGEHGDSELKMKEPRIGFKELADAGFNLAGKMGRLLKQEKRVSLESLTGIRTAYYDAFRQMENKSKPTNPKLLAFFDGEIFGKLKCLEAIRNLIAHRGGIVDQKFIDEVEPYSPSLYALPLEKALPVDGPLLSQSLSTVIEASVFLWEFVAEWLDKNPE